MIDFDIGDTAIGDVILPNGFVGGRTMYTPLEEGWDDDQDAELCDACHGAGCSFCMGHGHIHKNAKLGEHGHGLTNGVGVGHHHSYMPIIPSSYSSDGLRANYKRRNTRTRQSEYQLDLEDYDISNTWKYLFDIETEGSKAMPLNYDSLFNDPIVRVALDKVHEKQENELDRYGVKESILLGIDSADRKETERQLREKQEDLNPMKM